MATLLKGKPVVDHMAVDLRSRIEALKSRGVEPTLALVRMGERPDDLSYERTAKKRAASLGLATKPYVLDDLAPQAAVQATLQSINYDKTVHGCLMFRPLPSFLDEKALCNMLSPEKDIDGISLASLASVFTDSSDGFPPCTAQACVEILDFYKIPLVGKHVVVIGRSLVVGKPVSMIAPAPQCERHHLPFAHREPARAVPDGRHRHLRRRSRARVRQGILSCGADGARCGHQLRFARYAVRRCELRRG